MLAGVPGALGGKMENGEWLVRARTHAYVRYILHSIYVHFHIISLYASAYGEISRVICGFCVQPILCSMRSRSLCDIHAGSLLAGALQV